MIQIPLEIGDTILTGRFKNKKVTVKEIGTDEYGNITVNGRSILKIRIPKLYQKQENNMNLKEEVKPFQKSPIEVKIRKDGERFHIFLQTIDGEQQLSIQGWETKEQAEYAAMMKGYNFKGNPYSEDYEGLKVDKPSKREATKGTDKPEEMKLGKEKEIKLESMIKKAINEEISKKSPWVKVEVGPGLTLDAYKCPKDLIKILSSSPRVDKKNANKPGYVFAQLDSESPYRWFKLAEAKFSKKQVKLKEKELKLENFIREFIRTELSKNKVQLKEEIEVNDADIAEYAKLVDQIDKMKAELSKLTKRFDELDDKFRKMLDVLESELGDSKENFIRYKNILITIKRKGYERTNYKYKEAFEELYKKVNANMKKMIDEVLEANKTITKVSSSLSVQYEADNFIANIFNRVKTWFISFIGKLRNTNKSTKQLLDQLESKV